MRFFAFYMYCKLKLKFRFKILHKFTTKCFLPPPLQEKKTRDNIWNFKMYSSIKICSLNTGKNDQLKLAYHNIVERSKYREVPKKRCHCPLESLSLLPHSTSWSNQDPKLWSMLPLRRKDRVPSCIYFNKHFHDESIKS